ncbi:hypothetical protein DL546_003208 [Coniochaeta pulveracea]|uniref:Major facilitator superfamily (MFS) profile domain-containing protein n=1 Tax=Coniochaeta pulveracea TaxID=177199 RepID=A0A420XYG5_9PEZI|nr:hypothetical protein DL546_003208 [Coniochaeta pulveracea]
MSGVPETETKASALEPDMRNISGDSDSNAPQENEKAKVEINDDDYPKGIRLMVLCSASLVAVFLISLDQTIVGTAIPKITDEFHGIADVSWYAAAYFMTFGASQPSAGKIYKYYNIKWSFLAFMVIFEVGSLICGVAPNSKAFIVGRAIAGLGGAGLSVGGTIIVSLAVPPAKRPMIMGIIAMTYCVSAVLGPIIGGAFTDKVTWRWCFYINLPVGGVAALAVAFFFSLPAAAKVKPNETWKKKLWHIDPVGLALAMGCLICFILALQYGGATYAWGNSKVYGLIIGFGLIAIALVAWEIYMGEYAMLVPRLFKSRPLWSCAPYQFFFMGSYIVLLYYLPIYFQSILGASPIRSGVDNLPLVLAAAVFALVGGAVVMKTGRAQQVMFVGSALATVACGLIYTFDIGTSQSKWIGYQFFVGATIAFAVMHGLSIVQAYADPADLTAVTANLLFFQTVGGAFSTAAAQAAFVNRLLAVLPTMAPHVDPALVIATGASELRNVFSAADLPGVVSAYMVGLKAAFAVAVAFAGVACLSSVLIPFRKMPTHEGAEGGMAMA